MILMFSAASSPSDVIVRTLWKPTRIEGISALKSNPTVPKIMVESFRLQGIRVEFEKTDLAGLADTLGVSTGQDGDASEFERWLCLYGQQGSTSWILWITSGEIDGWKVGGLQLQELESNEQPDARCKSISTVAIPLGLGIPLHLQMKSDEVPAVLGRPSSKSGDLVEYFHEHEINIRNGTTGTKEPFTVMNSVVLVVRQGVVKGIVIWKSTQD
jgi:hypothetical protein